MAESFQGIDSIASIPAAQLRQAFRQTMVMGLPDDAAKPTFYFDRVADWTKHDREGNPYDWEEAPATETPERNVQVICAYDFYAPLGRQGAYQTEVGEFNPTQLVFTMLEDEFAEVNGFSSCTVGASSQRWHFRYWRPSYSLGDLTVFQVFCTVQGVA